MLISGWQILLSKITGTIDLRQKGVIPLPLLRQGKASALVPQFEQFGSGCSLESNEEGEFLLEECTLIVLDSNKSDA